MKMKWVAWVQHLGSRTWHDVASSEYFDVVYKSLVQYVRTNQASVKFHILMSHWSPVTLPNDFPAPTQMNG